jgi:cytochrome b subunit of formate dehydrogenase
MILDHHLKRGTVKMAEKISKLWIVNVTSFLLFALLGVTGLINWLLLPRGYGQGAGFLVSVRHSLVTTHEWAALLFIIVVGVHISLHWSYVKKRLDSYRKKK